MKNIKVMERGGEGERPRSCGQGGETTQLLVRRGGHCGLSPVHPDTAHKKALHGLDRLHLQPHWGPPCLSLSTLFFGSSNLKRFPVSGRHWRRPPCQLCSRALSQARACSCLPGGALFEGHAETCHVEVRALPCPWKTLLFISPSPAPVSKSTLKCQLRGRGLTAG